MAKCIVLQVPLKNPRIETSEVWHSAKTRMVVLAFLEEMSCKYQRSALGKECRWKTQCGTLGRAFRHDGSAHFQGFHAHHTHLRDAKGSPVWVDFCSVINGGGKPCSMAIVSGRPCTMIIVSGESFKCILVCRLEADPPEHEGQGWTETSRKGVRGKDVGEGRGTGVHGKPSCRRV